MVKFYKLRHFQPILVTVFYNGIENIKRKDSEGEGGREGEINEKKA